VVPIREYAAGDPAIFTARQADLFIQILEAMKAEKHETVASLGAKLLDG
jgi:hypothetical protein